MAGSPFFLKNFMHTLGHFDIYGCLLAIVLLLMPARSIVYVLLAAAVLGRADPDPPHPSPDVCADHRRHRRAAPLPRRTAQRRQNVAVGIVALWQPSALLFVAAQFCGTMRGAAEAEFVEHLQSRMADPSRTDLLSFRYIWYQPLSKEISDTWARLPTTSSACRCSRC